MATSALEGSQKLFTGNFLLVCFATLANFAALLMLVTTLPIYVVH